MGEDLLVLLEDFYHDQLDLEKLNYAFMVLIMKKIEKITVKDFRPISLLNSLYKIISKILALRLTTFLHNWWTWHNQLSSKGVVWLNAFSMRIRY